jgi:hypothetical protein
MLRGGRPKPPPKPGPKPCWPKPGWPQPPQEVRKTANAATRRWRRWVYFIVIGFGVLKRSLIYLYILTLILIKVNLREKERPRSRSKS